MEEPIHAPPSTDGAPANSENIAISQIARSLTVAQGWALTLCFVGLIGGSFAIGGWAQSTRDDDRIAEKDRTIAERDSRIAELKADETDKLREKNISIAKLESSIEELDREQRENQAKIDNAAGLFTNASRSYNALRGKADFLERFLTYVDAPTDISRKLFVDHVCALWKQSEEYSIHVNSAPLDKIEEQLRRGFLPDVRRFLIEKGVSSQLLDQAAFTSTNVTRTRMSAAATVQKQAQGISLAKIVRFFDGTTYKVPDEIALAVHSNPECAPR